MGHTKTPRTWDPPEAQPTFTPFSAMIEYASAFTFSAMIAAGMIEYDFWDDIWWTSRWFLDSAFTWLWIFSSYNWKYGLSVDMNSYLQQPSLMYQWIQEADNESWPCNKVLAKFANCTAAA